MKGLSRSGDERSRDSRPRVRPTSGDVTKLDIEQAMEIARRHATAFAGGEDRERLASEATSRAWEARGTYDARRGSLEQWMFGIVRNIAREWHRDRVRTQGLHRRLLRLPERTEELGDLDALADLRASFGRLDERQQLLLYLRYWCDLPYRDVCVRAGMSEAAARQAVRRALIELGRKMR
jgi:RNA polymerase sigma factor (sigma-70 family)